MDTATPLTQNPKSHSSNGVHPFVGERLWLDFVNTDACRHNTLSDALHDFDSFLQWMEAAGVIDSERSSSIRRRAQQQPAGAAAALTDARRVRDSLRLLAEKGANAAQIRAEVVGEMNRVLGRSAGTRRIEHRLDGGYSRNFVPVGDAFAGLMIPMVESAADTLIHDELPRVRRCAGSGCKRVFHDGTRNRSRRWCDMTRCGNRAKAARFRKRVATRVPAESSVSEEATVATV
jgi:predicted RNA-binding Zn ribbon-like protein